MITEKPYLGTKQPSMIDSTQADIPIQPGIYVGVVKRVDTNSRSGRLWVYISNFGGADPTNPRSWTLVSYASPYAGTTPGQSYEYGDAKPNENVFEKTQQSYGFYMTPPDPGSQILCCFASGSTEGFWFACVNTSYSKNMVPAIGSVPWNKIDQNSVLTSGISENLRPGTPYPVAEVNRYIPGIYTQSSFLPDIPKPIHVPQTIRLIIQGLDTDPVRGAIDSSSQRDPVSSVFGFSTPGRPYGNQDPARNSNLRETLASGNFNPEDFKVTTRVGGHSLVMDDGDIYGQNNLVRLKSANGHQILMNDSQGFMYIANRDGTAWIELTKEGDILVYGARDLSVRTQGNLMMHSDNNISFYAGKSFNIDAESSVKIQGQTITTNAQQTLNLYGKQAQIKSQSSLGVISGQSMSIKAAGTIAINGSAIALNGGGGGGEVAPPTPIPEYTLEDAVKNGQNWIATPGQLRSSNYKVPTHEPYIRGGIQREISNQEAILAASTKDIDGNYISPPVNLSNVGISQADQQAVKSPAPSSYFIKQPEPKDSIGILDKDGLRAYMAQTGYTESRGNYDTINQFGYQGKYQMGSLALQDLGYVKPGTPQTAEALANPNNWTGKNGINSNSDFLSNGAEQESAMYDYTKRNYTTLQSKGLITSETSAAEAAGLLSTSHLLGVGSTSKWVTTGVNLTDANGTTATTYYNQGKYSQTQVGVITASNASKTSSGG